jgi:hypothetical protein
MRRRLLVLCLCVLVPACQAPAVKQAVLAKPHPIWPITLHGDLIEANASVIQQALLAHIPLGTPIDEADALVIAQGFPNKVKGYYCGVPRVFESLAAQSTTPGLDRGIFSKLRAEKPVTRHGDFAVCLPWDQAYATICVVLFPDADRKLEDIGVHVVVSVNPYARYFKMHPELPDPVGMPAAEVRTALEKAGFHCQLQPPQESQPTSPSWLVGELLDESVLSGTIVRVRLAVDEQAIVRAAQVPASHWFDNERCMWLHGDESTTEATCKVALYPVRLGCRYALIGTCFCLWCVASGGATIPAGHR